MVVTSDPRARYEDFAIWGDVCGRAPVLDHHSSMFFEDATHHSEIAALRQSKFLCTLVDSCCVVQSTHSQIGQSQAVLLLTHLFRITGR